MMGDRWPAKWGSLLFVSENGTPINPSNLRRLIGRFAQDAGIDGVLNPYDLRHTATSLISAAGLSEERLADLLGDKDTRMVFGHYRHPVTSSVSVAAEYWGANQGAIGPQKRRERNRRLSGEMGRRFGKAPGHGLIPERHRETLTHDDTWRDSARVPQHARGHWFKSSRATKRNLRDCGGISLTLDNLNHYAEQGLTSADIQDRRAK